MNGRIETDQSYIYKTEYKLTLMPKYAEDWYYHLVANRTKPSTCYNYINKLYQFLLFIDWSRTDEITLDELNILNIEKYMIHIQTKDKNGNKVKTSDSYQSCVWSCLYNFFDFLYKRDYKEYNLIDKAGLEKPKVKDEIERYHFTKEDFKKILTYAKNSKEDGPERRRNVAILLFL